MLPEPAHSGVAPEHVVVQLPQWAGTVTSVSQPLSATVPQWAQPEAHADGAKAHWPDESHETVPVTWASAVQSWPQLPQLCTSLGTQPPAHVRYPAGHPPESGAPVSPASNALASLPARSNVASEEAASPNAASCGGASSGMASAAVASSGPASPNSLTVASTGPPSAPMSSGFTFDPEHAAIGRPRRRTP